MVSSDGVERVKSVVPKRVKDTRRYPRGGCIAGHGGGGRGGSSWPTPGVASAGRSRGGWLQVSDLDESAALDPA